MLYIGIYMCEPPSVYHLDPSGYTMNLGFDIRRGVEGIESIEFSHYQTYRVC